MSSDHKWQIPLSKAQKSDLDRSIIEYIDWHITNKNNNIDRNDLIQSLNGLFEISKNIKEEDENQRNQPGQLLLPRKWNSIAQLQRKIMDLEDTITQLNTQLETLNDGSKQLLENSEDNEECDDTNGFKIQTWTPRSSPFSSFIVESPITAIKLHPYLPIVIIGTNHGKLYLYDILNVSLPIASLYAHTKAITSIEIVQEREHEINIVTASKDLCIRSWTWNSIKPDKFKLQKTFEDHDHIISQIAWQPDYKLGMSVLFSCSRDNTIKVWNLHEGWCVKTIKNAHSDWIRSIDVWKHYVLSGGHDTSVRLTHWPTGNGLSMGVGHDFPIEKVLLIPLPEFYKEDPSDYNGKLYHKMGFKYCLTAGRDNLIKMWEIPLPRFTTNDTPIPNVDPESNQFKLIREFKGHTSWVRDIKLSQLGPFLFSCSDDKSLKMWNLDTGDCVKTWQNFHSGFINCIATDIDLEERKPRKLLVSGGIDCKCNILMN